MKNVWLVTVLAVAALFCGCQHTHVDQVQPSEGMQDWYKDIKENYPGFRPPQLISPGISGHTGPAAKVQTPAVNTPADSNIDAIPVDPVEEPKAEAEVNPEGPKAEAKTEVKAEEPKAEAKPEEAKAEVKDDKAEANPEVKTDNKIEPPDPTASEIYEVKSGDTLGIISKKFYGSVRFVNLIQKANSDIVTNANVLKPGMKLIIPKL